MRARWVSLICGDESAELLARHPNAFLLLVQIAMRARWKDCRITKLRKGEAFVGDWRAAGLKSESAYVHAKKTLRELGLATFEGTNKGTRATLTGATVFSISPPANNDPDDGRRDEQGDDPATTPQRADSDQTTTNKKDQIDNTEHNILSMVPDIVALYPKREDVQAACEIVKQHILEGDEPEAIRVGTAAIAAVIQRLPSKHLNKFVPKASTFFRNRRWRDDPQTWLRAGADRNGQVATRELDLGGRREARIINLSETRDESAADDDDTMARQLCELHPMRDLSKPAVLAAKAAIQRHGFDSVAEGVKSYAAAVAEWPDEQARFVKTATNFFDEDHWNQPAENWQRRKGLNGHAPVKHREISVGGREPSLNLMRELYPEATK